ncbi:MAG: peptide chain release factor N(5)-glutamine methyltransferase [Alphaproteobacteria bacterium]|nr:peptide chain release factor N(5)-glutamine methyltransferase [Alphaproteobacteria bacterium]
MPFSPRTKLLDWQPFRGEVNVRETLISLLGEAASTLSRAGFAEPRRLARRLVARALDLTPAELLGHPEQVLDEQQTSRFRLALDRMAGREPLSRILGRREFWSLEFELSPDTLDPRPETETVVEAVLRRVSDRRAPFRLLDLGAGTGCILLALLSELPAATGIGVDIVAGAMITARRNAAAIGLAKRAHFFVGDWGAALTGGFEVIVSNPPYIASAALANLPCEVALYDPCLALDGGADGLGAYRSLVRDLPRLLKPGAVFVSEVGLGQASAVAAILQASGLAIESCERDLAGIRRCVVARAL